MTKVFDQEQSKFILRFLKNSKNLARIVAKKAGIFIDMQKKEIRFEFFASKTGRLDVLLSEFCVEFSRSNVSGAIKNNLVLLNEKTENKPSKAVKIGDKITLLWADLREQKTGQTGQKIENSKNSKNSSVANPQAENLKNSSNSDKNIAIKKFSPLFDKIEILYEDDEILVISKPAGLVVHDAPSLNEPTLVDFLKASSRELATLGGEFRAGIVHRLDRLTSGAMVVAKSDFASANLSAQLKQKSASRIYLALTDLALKENCVIDRALARCEGNRLKKMVYPLSHPGAKSAKSAFCNIFLDEFYETSPEFSANNSVKKSANLIACKLFTGRTHQIRAHLASINRHILGDILYGFKGSCDILARIFLHAFILEFIHPRTEQKLQFIAPLPDDFLELLGGSCSNRGRTSSAKILACHSWRISL